VAAGAIRVVVLLASLLRTGYRRARSGFSRGVAVAGRAGPPMLTQARWLIAVARKGGRPSVSWLFTALWIALLIAALRTLAGRLLAVRIGLAAALLSGSAGVAAGFTVQRAVESEEASASGSFLLFRRLLAARHDGRGRGAGAACAAAKR